MPASKIDTRTIGLDVALAFSRWLTGAENLHYGDWTGLEVTAANTLAAQEAYTARLLGHMKPGAGQRILDIGGGAGETARKLTLMGHKVEIVVPSAFHAERCRHNAPEANVHECRFEEFSGTGPFDLCLFSESFQYIAPDNALGKARALLASGGEILIGDCFRIGTAHAEPGQRPPGGGHDLALMRDEIARQGLAVLAEEDITEAVAPSIELERGFYMVIGHAIDRIDAALREQRPLQRRAIAGLVRLMLNRPRRERLRARLDGRDRSAAQFIAANRYLIWRLAPT
ncbi:MAG: methyltransferase domain-containing protein [Pararhodobacter sp.]|nr:methyltransferase domain-containing protein [Pararhodobacter sp.]